MTDYQDNDNVQNDESAGTENTDRKQTQPNDPIPRHRFNQVIEERNELRAAIAKFEEERKTAEQRKLEEQQEYKQLYSTLQGELEQLKAVQDKAARYEEALRASNEARMQQIPEDRRSLVPEYDDPTSLGAWLDRNMELLRQTPQPRQAPSLDGGSGTIKKTASLPGSVADVAEIARRLGYTVDENRIASRLKNTNSQEGE